MAVKPWRTPSAAFFLLLSLVLPVPGESRFELFRTVFQIPERGEVAGYAVVTATHKITFLPPVGWTAEINRQKQEVILSNGDFDMAASFRLTSGTPPGLLASGPAAGGADNVAETEKAAAARKETLRELARRRFPNARVVHEFDCFADGHLGVALDMELSGGQGIAALFRVAVVPLPAGLAEFELRTAPAKAEDTRYGLAGLMASFHVTPLTGETPAPVPAGAAR